MLGTSSHQLSISVRMRLRCPRHLDTSSIRCVMLILTQLILHITAKTRQFVRLANLFALLSCPRHIHKFSYFSLQMGYSARSIPSISLTSVISRLPFTLTRKELFSHHCLASHVQSTLMNAIHNCSRMCYSFLGENSGNTQDGALHLHD